MAKIVISASSTWLFDFLTKGLTSLHPNGQPHLLLFWILINLGHYGTFGHFCHFGPVDDFGRLGWRVLPQQFLVPVDIETFGHVDMWICGHVTSRVLAAHGHRDMWTC